MRQPGPLFAVAAALLVAGTVVLALAFGNGVETTSDAPGTTATSDSPPSDTTAQPETTVTAFDRDQLPRDLATVSEDWATDFSRSTIEFDELAIGIRSVPIRDRIPPIDAPVFESAATAEHVADREPGLSLELNGEARFYPLSILTAHEIVNDVVGGQPVAVTFCPLCNSAIAFDRIVEGQQLRFGVSGLLRNSDLVMWDDVTESLWQQLTGEGLIGRFAGAQLTFVPSAITSFLDFTRRHPSGQVLGPDQGFGRRYGYNPYVGYSSRTSPYESFFSQDLDDRFPALERVVNVTIGETTKAYPFSLIEPAGAVNDSVDGTAIVVLWGGDTADALDAGEIPAANAIGTGIAFARTVDGQSLTFAASGDATFTDSETGSQWDLNGTAISGPMTGTQLEPVVHGNEFWFAWAVFNPEGAVYEAP
ncbi:MAG: DUF3179 domain-containing protein [Acidimicrobiia bacterium]|nr:DUF3179 domain-containing protein [Acidimicrobiia bacterium]NNL13684.1 DUF3179 domain-containing protein [Acidimicrobiia bacterium]